MQSGADADGNEQPGGEGSSVEQRLAAQQHVGAGVNRERAVEDRTRWSGTLHGTGQPAGKRNLRAFSKRREGEQQRDRDGRRAGDEAGGVRPVAREERGEVAVAGGPVDHDARPEQANIADAVGDESPEGGIDGVAPLVEEADEQG